MSKTPKENKIKTIQTSEQASKKKKLFEVLHEVFY